MSKVTKLSRTAPRTQRGAATLVVVLVLLFGVTVMAFFANRSFIFEQRTSANQYRSTKAFELAEAGVEWAIGRLNEGLPLATAPGCATTTTVGAASFRDRFVAPTAATPPAQPTGWLNVNAAAFPGCRFDSTGVANCDCPTAGQANLGTANPEQPRFGVSFVSVGGDPAAVEIIARGCTNGNTCDPTAPTAAGSDATAVVRVLVKIVPTITTGPAAALTTGAATVTGGNLNVINTHVPSNGITIHAGTTVSTGTGTNVTTIFGTPPRASVLDNDSTLNALSALGEDAFFNAFFGETLTHYSTKNPDVYKPACASASACATAIVAYINTGVQYPRIYIPGDVTFTNGTPGLGASLGTAASPVTLVSGGNIELGSNLVAYGMFYAASGSSNDWDYSGSGTVTVVGAFVTRGNFNKGNGTMNLVYDPSLWGAAGAPKGRLVRVPGSWRDKSSDF